MSIPTKIELTESQLAWLLKHYKHTKNAEAARKLGIGESTLHRFARKYGLKKTPQFMRKTQRAAADAAERSHRENGTYPPKGYRVPRSEVGQFKPGVSSRQRLGDKKEDARLQKMAETRRETIRKEKARILFGLPQKTKLKLTSGGGSTARLPLFTSQGRLYCWQRGERSLLRRGDREKAKAGSFRQATPHQNRRILNNSLQNTVL